MDVLDEYYYGREFRRWTAEGEQAAQDAVTAGGIGGDVGDLLAYPSLQTCDHPAPPPCDAPGDYDTETAP